MEKSRSVCWALAGEAGRTGAISRKGQGTRLLCLVLAGGQDRGRGGQGAGGGAEQSSVRLTFAGEVLRQEREGCVTCASVSGPTPLPILPVLLSPDSLNTILVLFCGSGTCS